MALNNTITFKHSESKNSLKKLPQGVTTHMVDFKSTVERWQSQKWSVKEIEKYLAVKHVLFKKYKFNIYVLQKHALVIQHWYVKKRASDLN
jgi:hypothetical protein